MVGAGIAGLCLARELASRGLAVTVLDDPHAGQAASRAATGLLQIAGGRVSASHLALRRACREYYDEFLASLPSPVQLNTHGHLRLGGEAASRASFLSTLRGIGIFGQAWSSDDLSQRTAMVVAAEGAVWLEDAALDPKVLLEALGRALVELGVVRRAQRVVDLVTGAAVDQHRNLCRADIIVLACGAGIGSLYQPGWDFRQEKGWGATFSGELALSFSVEGAGQTLIPLSPTRWKVGASTAWDPERPPLRAMVKWQGEEVSRVGGVRSTTPDGLPVVGCIGPGLFVLGGLGRNGLLTAPLLAKGLAQEILNGTAPAWLLPFAPGRRDIGRRRSWSR